MHDDAARQELKKSIKTAVSQQDAVETVKLVRTLAATSNRPSDVTFCATALNKLGDEMVGQLRMKRLRTYVVRSVTVEPVMPYLTLEAVQAGYVLDAHVGGYGSYVDEILSPTSALSKYKPDLVLVVLDLDDIAGRLPELCADGLGNGVEDEIEESVARVAQLLRGFRGNSTARLLLQGLVVPDSNLARRYRRR